MTRKMQLHRLCQIAELMRDRDLAALRRATEACAETRALIDGLEAPAAEGLGPVAAALAGQSYQLWAGRRRAELNLLLARQTADVLQCHQKAAQGFGKAEVLARLVRRV